MSERLPFAGRIKAWKHERGFGFVRCDDGRDLFCHVSVLKEAGLSSLEVGQRVRFELGPAPDGRVRCTKIALDQPPAGEVKIKITPEYFGGA